MQTELLDIIRNGNRPMEIRQAALSLLWLLDRESQGLRIEGVKNASPDDVRRY